MPSKDMDSIERDMIRCLECAVRELKRVGITPDASSVTTIALEMFKDYRRSTARDVVTDAIKEVFEGVTSLSIRKSRRWLW